MRNFGGTHELWQKNETSSGICSRMDNESSDIIVQTISEQWFKTEGAADIIILSEELTYPILVKPGINTKTEANDYMKDLAQCSQPCWIIDPICGSIGYARGIRDFIISIALVEKHDVLLAAVYDPPHDELFWAIKGEGAYLNGGAIAPSKITALDQAVISIEHRVYKDFPPHKIREIANATRRMRTAMTCALEMCYIACGRIDAMLKLDQAFYDYIGGALILDEALGGLRGLIDLDNGANVIPFAYTGCRASFAATNGLVTEELLSLIKT